MADDRFTTTATLQPPGSEWHFDFGEAGSPVASGYEQVTRFTEYQSSLGYGWVPGTMVSDNDSSKGDDLQRDYNYTRNGTFAVDLPDGTYDVTVTLGDSRHNRDLMSVSLEGTQVDLISTAKNEFVTRTYRVVVTDGQLSLELQDLGGKDSYATINALSIVAV